jgi:flagellar biogenesis protein FliO
MATQALQVTPGGLRSHWLGLRTALWERVLRISRRKPKSLRLCESLPLGERRFVAVVAFERRRFLVGGTASSLVLLTRLGDSGSRVEGETEAEPRGLAQERLEEKSEEKLKDWADEKRDEKC